MPGAADNRSRPLTDLEPAHRSNREPAVYFSWPICAATTASTMRRSTNGDLMELHRDGRSLFFGDPAGTSAAEGFPTWLAQIRNYKWIA
jgi:hypothetical protein